MKKILILAISCLAVLVAVISGCRGKGVSHSLNAGTFVAPLPAVSSAEKAVVTEKNPLGDIPDTQTFVKYASSPGGYQLDVPEGWARKESGANVAFSFDYDGLSVTIEKASGQPDAAGHSRQSGSGLARNREGRDAHRSGKV